ncbi:MAG: NblA/ycf18 family protein [Leptolyngbyaceae cyanobacterium bins.59]|nr:NblA/ycf18 family protein [Leptolyngbyaceae cyanobacterium bins.59]
MDPQAFELTLEQQFQMRLMEESVQGMSQEQAQELLLQAARLLMIKQNLIRDLVGKVPMEDSFAA